MLSAIGLPQPSIKVIPHQTLIFLHPPDFEDTPAHDPILRGEVVLDLPKPREVKRLTVKLAGHYNLSFPNDVWESGRTLEKEVNLEVGLWPGGSVLQKGEHRFAFALLIPSSTAPHERCQYGRVHHRLYATCQLDGVIGNYLEDEVGIGVIVNPAGEGDMMDCHIRAEGFAVELGPYFVELTSQHLTVAGLLNVSFHFPSVPEDTYILAVESYILQSYELQSFSDPSRRAIPQVQKRGLFRFDEQRHRRDIPVTFTATTRPPIPRHIRHPSAAGASAESIGFLSRGGSMQMSHLVRVPDDDYVRPSTQLGTKSVIRISHQIVVAITFRHCHDDGPAKVFRVTRPITFSSCCCMLDSLLLPSYSKKDPLCSAQIAQLAQTQSRTRLCHLRCICGSTMESLVRDQGSSKAKGLEDAISDMVVPIKTRFL